MSDGCVTSRVKMLTYYRVRSAFEATQALPSNMICGFKTRFGSFLKHLSRIVLKAVFSRRRRIGFSRFHPGNEKE